MQPAMKAGIVNGSCRIEKYNHHTFFQNALERVLEKEYTLRPPWPHDSNTNEILTETIRCYLDIAESIINHGI
jgi:hypothetical protein